MERQRPSGNSVSQRWGKAASRFHSGVISGFHIDWRVLNLNFEHCLVFWLITVNTDQKRGHRKGDRWHIKDATTFKRYGQQLYIAALGLRIYRYQNLRRLWLQTLIFCRLNITSSSLMLRARRHLKEEAGQLLEGRVRMVKSELKSKSPFPREILWPLTRSCENS